jgi:hypothetical protein
MKKEFEIYFSDLNEEAKERYLKFIGGKDNLQDALPITTMEMESNELDKVTIVIGYAPVSTKMEFAISHMDDDVQFPIEVSHNEEHYIIIGCTEGLDNKTILNGFDCLRDQMDFIRLDEWTDKFDCPSFIREVRYGNYYGQNIEIITYIIN